MGVEVHVEGRVTLGRFPAFVEAVERYCDHQRRRGSTVPAVLHGLSGPMNTVRLVYRYDALDGYEREEAEASADAEYARIASQMPFVDGTLTYTVYRAIGS